MSIDKILIINDNRADIHSIKKRIPDSIQVIGATQDEADNYVNRSDDLDLIILDNDAKHDYFYNSTNTRKAIKRRGIKAPIISTSYKPSANRILKSIMNMTNIIDINNVFDVLENKYDVDLLPNEATTNSQKSIIITYNSVSGFDTGIYNEGNLLISSHNRKYGDDLSEVLNTNLKKLYETFDIKANRDNIKNIFVYEGKNFGYDTAKTLKDDSQTNVYLVSCICNHESKDSRNKRHNVESFSCECGGENTLGRIADTIIGIKRLNEPYQKIPDYKIESPAKKLGEK